MQLSFRLDKRPGESHLALDGKNSRLCKMRRYFSEQTISGISSAISGKSLPNECSFDFPHQKPGLLG
jgi:hypothetical protein